MKPVWAITLGLASMAGFSATPAPAATTQPAWLGRWLIAEAHPAPWQDPADPGTAPVDAHFVGKSITFTRTRIVAPRLLACRGPRYHLVQVPPEGLFQGGLASPARQASSLGFQGNAIPTLQTGCAGAIDFHFNNGTTAMFALDNMVYTIRKQ